MGRIFGECLVEESGAPLLTRPLVVLAGFGRHPLEEGPGERVLLEGAGFLRFAFAFPLGLEEAELLSPLDYGCCARQA